MLMLFVGQPAQAIQPVGDMANAVSVVSKKEARMAKRMERAQKRMDRFMARVDRMLAKKGMERPEAIDLQDPVKKWMWFWILGWGAAIVLYILASVLVVGTAGAGFGVATLLSLLGSICGLFGTVSLVMWLVKMNS
ncbi:MAG: hypothetical protein D6818_10380 [Bacteroidetes bacterium]|nr:MAG: hypothetical protein D6818_10380 [Bacteroidota bacterium]